jgi:hypothetical protein
MKWKCTTSQLLSVPLAFAVIGLGINSTTIGQDVSVDQGSPNIGVTAPGQQANQVGVSAASALEAGLPAMRPRLSDRPSGDGMATALGSLVYDSSGANGTNGLSHFAGTLPPSTYDRTVVDDVVIPGGADLTGAQVCGVWFAGSGAPGPVANFRVRIWTDAGNTPAVGAPIHDHTGLGFTAFNTGAVFFGRPEVCYDVKFPNSFISGAKHWVSVQPTGTTDNFFHLTANDAPNLIGSQVYLWYVQDGNDINPQWTAGSVIFAAEHDVVMRLYASEGELLGACCLPKENGSDPDPACIDNILNVDCADLGGIFHANATCDGVSCPSQVECPDDDPCPACVGDINDSGVVDGADLLLLLGCWGPVSAGCECADLNNSGVIDGADLLLLLGNWGPCPQASGDGPGQVIIEQEPKCERWNDGCNMDVPAFDDISCGDVVCGTAWTDVEFAKQECPGEQGHLPGSCGPNGQHCGGQSPDGCWCDSECWGFTDCCIDICDECFGAQEINTRDTDWYLIEVKEKRTVTWRVHAEFPAQAIIAVRTPDCANIAIVASAQSQPKVPFEVSACLQPDKEYILFVSPTVFEGLPCDKDGAQWGNTYTAEVICTDPVDCPQKGACCIIEECFEDQDEFSCFTKGGNFVPGATCADNPCELPVGACCLKDQCVVTDVITCLNDLEGAFRGGGTDCDDLVPIDIGCNGSEQLVPICRDCGAGGQVWCNLQDLCDQDINQDPYNGGCNYFDEAAGEFDAAFEQVCCGDLVGGSIWSIAGQGRDLDWRVLTLNEQSAVTIQLDHGFGQAGLQGIIFIATAGCPASIVQSAVVSSGQGLLAQLQAGTYYVIVAPEFSTGTDILCGTPASQYQLQINCGPLLSDICDQAPGCVSFRNHPGFPSGLCSCDPDFCDLPAGAIDPNNPNYCCPNICDYCPCDLPNVCNNNPNATWEGEVCGANTNGGCNTGPGPENFVFVNDGDQICGTVWAQGGTRDTDWFRVTVGPSGTVSGTVTAFDAPQVVFIVNATWSNCTGIAVVGTIGWADGENAPGSQGTATASGLTPGSEVVVFTATGTDAGGGIFDGYPCDNDYLLDISAP